MLIQVLKSKIHRAVVTESNLNYVGSITIDKELMEKADLVPGEKVQIVNNNNGARFETYVIEGKRDSGVICVNGGASRLVQPEDILIIISYGLVEKNHYKETKPRIIFVDNKNNIVEIDSKEKHSQIK